MGVLRPAWWDYPLECENGHEWGPGRVIVSFARCDCAPVRAAYPERGSRGHLSVACREPGCRSVWYSPRHERGGTPGPPLCSGWPTPGLSDGQGLFWPPGRCQL